MQQNQNVCCCCQQQQQRLVIPPLLVNHGQSLGNSISATAETDVNRGFCDTAECATYVNILEKNRIRQDFKDLLMYLLE